MNNSLVIASRPQECWGSPTLLGTKVNVALMSQSPLEQKPVEIWVRFKIG